MEVAAYEPLLFAELPSFEEAQLNLARLEEKLETFGNVVSSHDGDDRIGLALLHKHFDLEPDELLVERVVADERVSIGQPRIVDVSEEVAAPSLPCQA
jgi:hypothetical protein